MKPLMLLAVLATVCTSPRCGAREGVPTAVQALLPGPMPTSHARCI